MLLKDVQPYDSDALHLSIPTKTYWWRQLLCDSTVPRPTFDASVVSKTILLLLRYRNTAELHNASLKVLRLNASPILVQILESRGVPSSYDVLK